MSVETFKKNYYVKDLRSKILFVIFGICIFRFGSYIPIPYIDSTQLIKLININPVFSGLTSEFKPEMSSKANFDGFPATKSGFLPVAVWTEATIAPTSGKIIFSFDNGNLWSKFVATNFAPDPIYELARQTRAQKNIKFFFQLININ